MTSENQLPEDVVAALENGRTVDAVKRLRALEGLGLKEAKERIDAHLAANPNRYPKPETGSGGRFLMFAVILVAVALTVRFFIEN